MKVNWRDRVSKAIAWIGSFVKALFSRYCTLAGIVIIALPLVGALAPYGGYVDAYSPFSASSSGNNAPWIASEYQGAMADADFQLDQLQSELAYAFPEVPLTHVRYGEIGSEIRKYWRWPMPWVLESTVRREIDRTALSISDEDWADFKDTASKGYQAFSFHWIDNKSRKSSCILVPGNIFIDDRNQLTELASGDFASAPQASGTFMGRDNGFVNRHELMHCLFGDERLIPTGVNRKEAPLTTVLRNESFADVAASLWMFHDGFSPDYIRLVADARAARVWHGVKTASDPIERGLRKYASLFSFKPSDDVGHYSTPALDAVLALLAGPTGEQVRAMNLRQIAYLAERIVKIYGAGGEAPVDGVANVDAFSKMLEKFEAGQCGSGTDFANMSSCGVPRAFLRRLTDVFPEVPGESRLSKPLRDEDFQQLIAETMKTQEPMSSAGGPTQPLTRERAGKD